jgi:acetaldehyde dehydrogenase (acetylating)
VADPSASSGQDKVKCAIVGSGNIGTDLLFKLRHDTYLEVALVVGVDPSSEGLALSVKSMKSASDTRVS